MTASNKESLSAFIDGEAQEVEVHRLLREFREDKALKSSWAAYQQAGFLARQAPGQRAPAGKALTPAWHEALLDSIHAAVAAEPAHGQREAAKARLPQPGLPWLAQIPRLGAGGLAAAASLLLAAGLGIALLLGGGLGQEPPAPVARAPFEAGPLDAAGAEQGRPLELTELDEDKQRWLRNYLNQHRRMARMKDRAQPVNFGKGRPQLAAARPSDARPGERSSSAGRAQGGKQGSKPAWRVSWLPEGFKPISASGFSSQAAAGASSTAGAAQQAAQQAGASQQAGARLHFTDGAATLSVFVERTRAHELRGSLPAAASAGGTLVVVHQPRSASHRVTVVGNVPAPTLRRVAQSVVLAPF